jgi:16S rRNA (uracil1498-N3)-methyltransferase
MPLHRFFVAPEQLGHTPIALEGALAHQLSRVLRFRPGERIELLDGSGEIWVVTLEQVTPELCLASPISHYRPATEPSIHFVLYQAISKGHKLDWVCQKAVELGVGEVVPMATARSIGADRRQVGGAKLARLQRIAQEAAEQAGRTRIPQVRAAIPLAEALAEVAPDDLALMGALAPEALSLRRALASHAAPPSVMRLYIGPEGGFEEAEVEQARTCGVLPVSLGPRTLRTETAGVALLAIVAYALGELEPR